MKQLFSYLESYLFVFLDQTRRWYNSKLWGSYIKVWLLSTSNMDSMLYIKSIENIVQQLNEKMKKWKDENMEIVLIFSSLFHSTITPSDHHHHHHHHLSISLFNIHKIYHKKLNLPAFSNASISPCLMEEDCWILWLWPLPTTSPPITKQEPIGIPPSYNAYVKRDGDLKYRW